MTSFSHSATNSLRGGIRQFFRNFNLEVRRFNPDEHADLRRAKIIDKSSTSVVLDVGANTGKYGRSLRKNGYQGRILSFEPLSDAFQVLQQTAARDPLWNCLNIALGSTNGDADINVSGNSVSSSLLPMDDTHSRVAPDSAYIGTERITVKRLDDVLDQDTKNQNIFLKLDVQGFEHEALAGAEKTLSNVVGLEIELSLAPLYSGHLSFRQLTDLLDDLGFSPVSVDRGLTDSESGHILQIDGIYVRR